MVMPHTMVALAPIVHPRFRSGGLVKRMPVHLRARIGDVGQNARRSEKDIIFDHRARVDRNIVLNLDIVSDDTFRRRHSRFDR